MSNYLKRKPGEQCSVSRKIGVRNWGIVDILDFSLTFRVWDQEWLSTLKTRPFSPV